MSSVGSFFSYVNDERSHEPENFYINLYYAFLCINFKSIIYEELQNWSESIQLDMIDLNFVTIKQKKKGC